MNNIENIVKNEIAKILKIRGLKMSISLNTKLKEELNLTSLNVIALINSICVSQSIDTNNICECQIIRMKTVADMVLMFEQGGCG